MNTVADSPLSISVRNLGGIESKELSLRPGVTIFSGQNATNRTSLLGSIAAGLGANESAATLKTDAEHGSVTLSFGDIHATREYTRENGTISMTGSPLTENAKIVDTYISIFSTNPARRAIRTGGKELREVLMRGVDTGRIKQEVQSLKQQQSTLETQLSEIETAQNELSNKEQRRQELTNQLEDLEAEIATVEQKIEEYKATSEEIEEAEEHIEKIERKREELRRVENELETTKESLQSLEDEKENLDNKLADLSVPEEQMGELKKDKRQLKTKISSLQSSIAELSDIISHNRSILKGDGTKNASNEPRHGSSELDSASDDGWTYGSGWAEVGSVIDSLDPDQESVECWTCGSVVKRTEIESRIETLADIRKEKNADLKELQSEVDALNEEINAIKQKQNEHSRIEREIEETVETIQSEQRHLDKLESQRETLQEEVEKMQSLVSDTEELRDSDLPDAYERLSSLERDRGNVENQLHRIEDTIADLEKQINEKDAVQDQLRETKNELDEARGRIDAIEREIVDQFNSRMDDLLDRLQYKNVSRVWIERIVKSRSEKTEFELHIVREAENGNAYEDTVDTLSESEREVIGIVTALVGYLVHDVDSKVPFLLFDSVEAIDADRLESLLDYIGEYASYVLLALLPEDAEAIDKQTIEAPAFD